jgi:hypothetical protein
VKRRNATYLVFLFAGFDGLAIAFFFAPAFRADGAFADFVGRCGFRAFSAFAVFTVVDVADVAVAEVAGVGVVDAGDFVDFVDSRESVVFGGPAVLGAGVDPFLGECWDGASLLRCTIVKRTWSPTVW